MADYAQRVHAADHDVPAPTGRSMAGPRQEQLVALQAMLNASPPVQRLAAMPHANRTGMPDDLKHGIEAMSGMSMDNVRVHRNSSKPAQLQAHAFAQGTDIHLAPGQEKHLPHEAWHVVQQAQGRVRPTMQLKSSVAINDDVTLEAEADVMGARAAEWSPTIAGSPPSALSLPDGGGAAPAQRRVDPLSEPTEGYHPPSFQTVAPNPAEYGILVAVDWVPIAENIYDTIDEVERDLLDGDHEEEDDEENDEDPENWGEEEGSVTESGHDEEQDGEDDDEEAEETVEKLDQWEAAADDLVTTANTHVEEFDTTRGSRVAIADELHQDRADLMALLAEIQEEHRISPGGFGAKGRAADIGPVSVETDYQGDDETDNHFISGISVNGGALTDRHTVVRGEHDPDAAKQRLRVDGEDCEGDPPDDYEDGMTAVDTDQGIVDRTNFASTERGPGQELSMNRTNARGYAWATQTEGWDTTQWEWLHIRGASLGGATGPTNLVLGTRDSNTHMMPFESNLKALAAVARRDDRFTGVTADWIPGGEITPHKWNTITITWHLNKAADAPEDLPEPHGTAQFAPLHVDTVLSKTEVAFLEKTLRDGLPPEQDDEEQEGGAAVEMEESDEVVPGGGENGENGDQEDGDNEENDDESGEGAGERMEFSSE